MTISQPYGELTLAFTTSFELIWDDRSQFPPGNRHVCFWRVRPPEGFYALGSVGKEGWDDINGTEAALCVQAEVGAGKPLAHPVGYTKVWDNRGMDKPKASCWRPTPPEGYVALGDVFVGGALDSPPPLTEVVCVAEGLTEEATCASDSIYKETGTSADKKFSAWEVTTPDGYFDRSGGTGLFGANAFIGMKSRDQPGTSLLRVLKLPIEAVRGGTGSPPVLSGRAEPDASTEPVTEYAVVLPFWAVKDDKLTVAERVARTPFYTVERRGLYELVLFEDNTSSIPQEKSSVVRVGVSESQSTTFEVDVNLKVRYDTGVRASGSRFSATLSLHLGYSHTTSVSAFTSVELGRTLRTPAGTAAGLWVVSHELRVLRGDGTETGGSMGFSLDSFYTAQYPAAQGLSASATSVEVAPDQVPSLEPA